MCLSVSTSTPDLLATMPEISCAQLRPSKAYRAITAQVEQRITANFYFALKYLIALWIFVEQISVYFSVNSLHMRNTLMFYPNSSSNLLRLI